ncbi:uncharacterized protein [Apostichopus japonicus]|uniref:uncharacterized protein n=1 Tax=Stichopus japonicus TaxID=307972 RepID=UPI003AB6BA4E
MEFSYSKIMISFILCVILTSPGAHGQLLQSLPTGRGFHRQLWSPFSYHSLLLDASPFQTMIQRPSLSMTSGYGFVPRNRLWKPLQQRLLLGRGGHESLDDTIRCEKRDGAMSTNKDIRNPQFGQSSQQTSIHHRSNGPTETSKNTYTIGNGMGRGTASKQYHNTRQMEPVRDTASNQPINRQRETNTGNRFQREHVSQDTTPNQRINRQREPARDTASDQRYNNPQMEHVSGTTSSQQNNHNREPARGTTSNRQNNHHREPARGTTSKQQNNGHEQGHVRDTAPNQQSDRQRGPSRRQRDPGQNKEPDGNYYNGNYHPGHADTGPRTPHTPSPIEIKRIEIGGYHPTDIEITLQNNNIHVKGLHRCNCEENCFEKEFERKIPLPGGINPRKVRAMVNPADEKVLVIKGAPWNAVRLQMSSESAATLNIPIEGHFKPIKTDSRTSDPSCGGRKRGIKLKKMDARSKQVIDDLDIEDMAVEEKYEGEIDEDGVTIEIDQY